MAQNLDETTWSVMTTEDVQAIEEPRARRLAERLLQSPAFRLLDVFVDDNWRTEEVYILTAVLPIPLVSEDPPYIDACFYKAGDLAVHVSPGFLLEPTSEGADGGDYFAWGNKRWPIDIDEEGLITVRGLTDVKFPYNAWSLFDALLHRLLGDITRPSSEVVDRLLLATRGADGRPLANDHGIYAFDDAPTQFHPTCYVPFKGIGGEDAVITVVDRPSTWRPHTQLSVHPLSAVPEEFLSSLRVGEETFSSYPIVAGMDDRPRCVEEVVRRIIAATEGPDEPRDEPMAAGGGGA